MSPDRPRLLLVNPWIHDFAAYDFWARPLGLLTLAGLFRDHGFRVRYLDCLDRFHPRGSRPDPRARHGRGPLHKSEIPVPDVLRGVPRRFRRYGVEPDWFDADLRAESRPDLILVTSIMTYWYPGVRETIDHLRRAFPETPILLGGIYATLLPEHASTLGADRIVVGGDFGEILRIAGEMTGFRPALQTDPHRMDTWPRPALERQREIPFAPLLTAIGCPFRCAYCASDRLAPRCLRRSPEHILEEIRFWHERCGVRDFVFYDDALLLNAERHAYPLLESVICAELPIRFHTPNAVHIREIDGRMAEMLFRSGFHTLRLGLETAAFEERSELDRKVTEAEFGRSVAALKRAGFPRERVGAYLLAGLPGQSVEAVEASIRVVREAEITPVPAWYTPIPGTPLWPAAAAASRYDLESDPLLTNNALVPCWPEFSWDVLTRLKTLAQAG
ncbi:MAG: B12-binding domain-containing radical SAM protein [Desulfococcaceae bacterium]